MGTILKIVVALAIAAALLWVSGTLSGKVVNKIGDTAYAVSYNPKLKQPVPKECAALLEKALPALKAKRPAGGTAQVQLASCPGLPVKTGSVEINVYDTQMREENEGKFMKSITVVHLFGLPILYVSSTAKLDDALKPAPVPSYSDDEW
ncbi:MAG: hypothetical protein J6Y56_08650 [Fibrobacterales bacterium]|nr:hypothetical protein [Fibrobacterales bacterium]